LDKVLNVPAGNLSYREIKNPVSQHGELIFFPKPQ